MTQAKNFTAAHVDARIEEFIKNMNETLEIMSDKEFNLFKKSLIKIKKCVHSNLKEEFWENVKEIASDYYIFDRRYKEISALDSLSIDEVRKWFKDHFINGSSFRKLSTQVIGTTDAAAKDNKIQGKTYRCNFIVQIYNIMNLHGNSPFSVENSTATESSTKKYSLKYLTDENSESKKAANYFIDDIESFKHRLPIYSTHKFSK